jgi:hypothetical protein
LLLRAEIGTENLERVKWREAQLYMEKSLASFVMRTLLTRRMNNHRSTTVFVTHQRTTGVLSVLFSLAPNTVIRLELPLQ